MEKACKRKKDQHASGERGEASFFHGGHAAVAELAHSDFHHSVPMQQSGVRDWQVGEVMVSMDNSAL